MVSKLGTNWKPRTTDDGGRRTDDGGRWRTTDDERTMADDGRTMADDGRRTTDDGRWRTTDDGRWRTTDPGRRTMADDGRRTTDDGGRRTTDDERTMNGRRTDDLVDRCWEAEDNFPKKVSNPLPTPLGNINDARQNWLPTLSIKGFNKKTPFSNQHWEAEGNFHWKATLDRTGSQP
ncbi:hypothetical protein CC2G_006668 [Coprinopsis cinerea AmutBmut pab1-1]|nr:hypothetical protein CC2G_006668 [Coprinopsis cinerea AmutBmut pab1-1]